MRRREVVVLLLNDIPMSRSDIESRLLVDAPRTGCPRTDMWPYIDVSSRSSAVCCLDCERESQSLFSNSSGLMSGSYNSDSSICTNGWCACEAKSGLLGETESGRLDSCALLKKVLSVSGVRPSLSAAACVACTGVDGSDCGSAALPELYGSNMLSRELSAIVHEFAGRRAR